MDEQQQIPFNVEPHVFALTNAQIAFSDEEFTLVFFSGNSIRRYMTSPKHAKRVALLLEKCIHDYEKKHGELKTELPPTADHEKTSNKKTEMGFKA